MPSEFNYTLGMNPAPFVEATKTAAAADKQLGETIKATAKDASAAQKDLTAAVQDSAKAAQQAQAQAATTTRGTQDAGIKGWIADMKAQGVEAAKAKIAVEDLGRAGAKAGDGFAKMGRDVGSMKGMLAAGLFSQVSGELMGLGRDLAETHPKLGALAEGIGTIGSMAGQGAMFGPWGAAIGAAIGVVTVAYKELSGPSERQKEIDEASAKASETLAKSIEQKAERMKEAAKAAREYTADLADQLRQMQANNTAAANRGLDFRSAMAGSDLDARRAAAGGLEGKAGVEANRNLDKEEVDQKFKDKEARLKSNYDEKRDPLERLQRDRHEADINKGLLSKNDEEGRNRMAIYIEGLDKEIAKMAPAVESAKQALEGFQGTKDRLMQAEKQVIDNRADVQAKKATEAEEKEKTAAYNKARNAPVEGPPLSASGMASQKEQMAKAEEEAKRRGIDTTKGGWALKLKDSIVHPPAAAHDDDGDEDALRDGRGGVAARRAAHGRRIFGVGSGHDRHANGRRLSEETRDPRIAARGKPQAEHQLSKGEQAILKVLGDIYRETRKNNNQPKK